MSKAVEMAEITEILEAAVQAMDQACGDSEVLHALRYDDPQGSYNYWHRMGEGALALRDARNLLRRLRERGN